MNLVAAVVLMGDPSHVTGQPFDQGTSQKNGVSKTKKNLSGQDRLC